MAARATAGLKAADLNLTADQLKEIGAVLNA
jgi:hypothetical protein